MFFFFLYCNSIHEDDLCISDIGYQLHVILLIQVYQTRRQNNKFFNLKSFVHSKTNHVQEFQIAFIDDIGQHIGNIIMGLRYVFLTFLPGPYSPTIFRLAMLYLRSLLHVVPISVRRSIVKKSTTVPLWLSRSILNFATCPIGDERKWIHRIKQSTWKGVWIVPNLNSLKQAEDTALNNDLVILYSHGKY